ncbi:MAG: UMP kinase [Planctomycetota bacterium]|nr:MAG: UMP kinase [Planctomycetota bacterium]
MTQKPVLLKLSGEALRGSSDGIFDPAMLSRVAEEIQPAVMRGQSVALVIGGGNIIRGKDVRHLDQPRGRSDDLGMLATLINAVALRAALEQAGVAATVVAPYAIPNVSIAQDRALVRELLAKRTVVIFGGGTGQPFFTTDTAAALRAAEIGARCLLKGSQVDGVYSADPAKDPHAKRYDHLTFDEAISQRLQVMDTAAFALCREQAIPIRVFDMHRPGSITAALGPNPPGTLVHDPKH